jgi:hypothetical protein
MVDMKLCNYNWNVMEMGYLRYIYPAIYVFEMHDVIGIYAGGYNAIAFNLAPERKKAKYEFALSQIIDNMQMLHYALNVSDKHVLINWIHRW